FRALLYRLRVEPVEVDRLEQELGEAAAADYVRDRLARERVQRVRAERADQHSLLFGVVALDVEDPGLRDLDQEDRRILLFGLDGQRERDLERARRDALRARADADLSLRRGVGREHGRRLRRLEGQILHVDLLEKQLLRSRGLGLLICHIESGLTVVVLELGLGARLVLEQPIELAIRVERAQVLEAADVLAVDEDLRHGAATAALLHHLLALLWVEHHVDLGDFAALAREQALRGATVAAKRRRIHDDSVGVRHGHFTSGKLSARQPRMPPRRLNEFT